MKCVICARETRLGEAYALPSLTRAGDSLTNLYACSRDCRDEWRNQRANANAPAAVTEIEITAKSDNPQDRKDAAEAAEIEQNACFAPKS